MNDFKNNLFCLLIAATIGITIELKLWSVLGGCLVYLLLRVSDMFLNKDVR